MGLNQKFNLSKDAAKQWVENNVKQVIIKIAMKYVLPVVLGLVLLVGAFFVIEEAIKNAAEKVVSAAEFVVSLFDNKSDAPKVTISDDLIKEIKKEMEKGAIDVDETYLTDALLKASLSAYYATQYPYIDGVDYGDDNPENIVSDVVKGCIYLKRGKSDDYMEFVNYDKFKGMLGDKNLNQLNDAKDVFSVDDDGNIVIATWSLENKVTETIQEDGTYKQDGSETSATYKVEEYKIDQKSITQQYSMSYKLPILLANMYSNEGFGIAVANLARNSRIELSILDSTSTTTTTSKEYFKYLYKVNGTYSWRNFEGEELKTEPLPEIDNWEEDYTTEDRVYQMVTEETETNEIKVIPTLLDTWTVKGEVSVSEETEDNVDTTDVEIENEPKDFTTDSAKNLTEAQIEELKQKIVDSRETGDITAYSIEQINATIQKKMEGHKKTTIYNNKETTYTTTDMNLLDNTDKFLALIRANSNGEYDKKGDLVEYIIKGYEVEGSQKNTTPSKNINTKLTGENKEKMQQMIARAIEIANDEDYQYYLYSESKRNEEHYYDCSSFCYRLYKHFFDIDIPSTTDGYGKENCIGNVGQVELEPRRYIMDQR